MSTIKTRRYIFRQRPRRLRLLALAGLVGSAAFGVTAVSGGDANSGDPRTGSASNGRAVKGQALDGQDRAGPTGEDVLGRLTAPSGPIDADRVDFDAPRSYAAIGGEERFVLEMSGKGGLIRFDCTAPGPACAPGAETGGEGTVHVLRSVSGAEGEAILIDEADMPVLRIAITGGMTLLHGSALLPASVPPAGRAMLPEKTRTASLRPPGNELSAR